jgi:hypothetical protein
VVSWGAHLVLRPVGARMALQEALFVIGEIKRMRDDP